MVLKRLDSPRRETVGAGAGVVTAQLAARRSDTQSTLTRSEAHGGGPKVVKHKRAGPGPPGLSTSRPVAGRSSTSPGID